MGEERKPLTVPDLETGKQAGEKAVMVSIPHHPCARWVEWASIDIAGVADPLGMTNSGHPNSLLVDMLGYDLLCVFDQLKPKCTGRYAQLSKVAVEALQAYAGEVRGGKFPDAEHAYSMKPEEPASSYRCSKAEANASGSPPGAATEPGRAR